jgi:hypothetical protein
MDEPAEGTNCAGEKMPHISLLCPLIQERNCLAREHGPQCRWWSPGRRHQWVGHRLRPHLYSIVTILTITGLYMKQRQCSDGAQRRDYTDAEDVGHLSLGVQDVVHQGDLHLGHLVKVLPSSSLFSF